MFTPLSGGRKYYNGKFNWLKLNYERTNRIPANKNVSIREVGYELYAPLNRVIVI